MENIVIITVKEPGKTPREYELRAAKGYRLGREGDIVLRDRLCSRLHLCVKWTEAGVLEFVDLGSLNGTFVRGVRQDKGALALGEALLMGRTQIVFDSKAKTPSFPAVTQGDIIERPDYVR